MPNMSEAKPIKLDAEPPSFGSRLFASESVIATIRRESERFQFRETGGVLFGYQTEDADFVVTNATGPGPDARHRRSSFEPDTAYCQAQLNAIHKATNGIISYIGEWHTHPLGDTKPSRQDLRSMLELANDPSTQQPSPLLWIFRPKRKVLGWRWAEEWSTNVLDAKTETWRAAKVQWFVATVNR